MSTKTKITLAVIVLLAIAATLAVKLSSLDGSLVPANPTPSAPIQVAASQPAILVHPPQVVAPSAKPVPASGTAPDPVPSVAASIAQNRTDLKTYVPTLVHLLETDDFDHLLDCVMQPDEIAHDLKYKTREELAARLHQQLETHGGVSTWLNALRSIDGRDPDFDPTGTQATYKLDTPLGGGDEIVFTKKDGLWYGPH